MNKFKLHLCCIALFSVSVFSCKSEAENVKTVPATEFQQKVSKEGTTQLVDVRTPEEFSAGHIEGAKNYNIEDPSFETNVASLDKNKPVFVYCKAGGRSSTAANKLREMGFTEVYELEGGMTSWKNKDMPLAQNTATGAVDDEMEVKKPTESEAGAAFTKAEFDKLISENPVVVVDFSATWCGPCKQLSPVLAKLEKEFVGKVKVQKIDVDLSEDLAREMGVEGIPYVVKYVNGQKANEMIGFNGEAGLRQLFVN